jgi:murein DD-endopeptidase MepM/ murein hydrolase activator NlpD
MLVKKYKILLISFIFISFCQIAFGVDLFKVYYKQINDKEYAFFADNNNYCPYQLLVTPELADGMYTDTFFPYYNVIKPQEKEIYLFSVYTKVKTVDLKIKFKKETSFGDPRNYYYDNDYSYILPFEEGIEFRVTQGYSGRFSHRGWTKYSVDLGMEIGTPICSARDGVVVAVKDDSSIGGRYYRYRYYANYVIVYHDDGTFAEYMHIKKNGSAVKVGDRIKTGETIAFSGNTGWTLGPHLHFMVFRPEYLSYSTIPTKFIGENGKVVEVETKKTYFSYHTKNENSVNNDANVLKNGAETDTNLGGF